MSFWFFNGIRIDVQDAGARTQGKGTQLIGVQNGMTLNFTMQNSNAGCPGRFGLTNCVRWVATHEFGHALGFAHEQIRGDTPITCTEPDGGTAGNVIFTEWDLDSIMNYCNPNYNGFGVLSPVDILTVQTYYGGIPTYSEANTLQVPVVQVGNANHSASLSDFDGNGRFTLDTFSPTTDQSSKPATYDSSSSILELPLVRVIDGAGHVISLYSATMQRESDGEFTISSHSLIQPVPNN